MTWQQQIAGLKRQLGGKQAHARKKWSRNPRESRPGKVTGAPVIVTGDVSQEFLGRMRTMGVRVEIRS